ncbi:MAG: hypothetical protein KatS3mg087_0473 [Patescibacteria group bacterium]|nr:MAG: hypothetical protein KatS3mg087_0473 [Patescibacteria group bacterium]
MTGTSVYERCYFGDSRACFIVDIGFYMQFKDNEKFVPSYFADEFAIKRFSLYFRAKDVGLASSELMVSYTVSGNQNHFSTYTESKRYEVLLPSNMGLDKSKIDSFYCVDIYPRLTLGKCDHSSLYCLVCSVYTPCDNGRGYKTYYWYCKLRMRRYYQYFGFWKQGGA